MNIKLCIKGMNRERIAKPHDISGIEADFYIRVMTFLKVLVKRKGNANVSLIHS